MLLWAATNKNTRTNTSMQNTIAFNNKVCEKCPRRDRHALRSGRLLRNTLSFCECPPSASVNTHPPINGRTWAIHTIGVTADAQKKHIHRSIPIPEVTGAGTKPGGSGFEHEKGVPTLHSCNKNPIAPCSPLTLAVAAVAEAEPIL